MMKLGSKCEIIQIKGVNYWNAKKCYIIGCYLPKFPKKMQDFYNILCGMQTYFNITFHMLFIHI